MGYNPIFFQIWSEEDSVCFQHIVSRIRHQHSMDTHLSSIFIVDICSRLLLCRKLYACLYHGSVSSCLSLLPVIVHNLVAKNQTSENLVPFRTLDSSIKLTDLNFSWPMFETFCIIRKKGVVEFGHGVAS